MLVVAGLSLKNLKPRVWDPDSPHYLPDLKAIMVSYADFAHMPLRRREAMREGLRSFLGVPSGVTIYLDNGAFYQMTKGSSASCEVRKGSRASCEACKGSSASCEAYEEFVALAQPDWYVIPRDFIPTPLMADEEQINCLRRTMAMNRAYSENGYVPVIHVSRFLSDYVKEFLSDERLRRKRNAALGGVVPNMLRAPKAMPYVDVLNGMDRVRRALEDQHLHVFGLGGVATMHIALLLGMDSADSSGWRNRAARGIVQLPGRGDRVAVNLGKWRGRDLDAEEWALLAQCPCPACQSYGPEGLKANGLAGFCHRATHNLWTLLDEVKEAGRRLSNGTYQDWYQMRIDNSIYRPLIQYLLALRGV